MPAVNKKGPSLLTALFYCKKKTSFLIFRVLTKVWILLNL
jgi:hypothetical protein